MKGHSNNFSLKKKHPQLKQKLQIKSQIFGKKKHSKVYSFTTNKVKMTEQIKLIRPLTQILKHHLDERV